MDGSHETRTICSKVHFFSTFTSRAWVLELTLLCFAISHSQKKTSEMRDDAE